MDQTIIFLHVQKTAGTTLNLLLEKQFPVERCYTTYPIARDMEGSWEGFLQLSQEKKRNLAYLSGHLGYGVHQHLEQKAVYITVLRDPVARLLSHYYHEKREASNPYHEYIQKGMGIVAYAEAYQALAMDNIQTRMLAGNWDKKGVGPCSFAMVEQAKENVARAGIIVGLTEQFDSFLLVLRQELGLRLIPYGYLKAATATKSIKDRKIDPEIIAQLEHISRYDMKLYEEMRVKQEERLAQFQDWDHWQLSFYKYTQPYWWQLKQYSVREKIKQFMR